MESTVTTFITFLLILIPIIVIRAKKHEDEILAIKTKNDEFLKDCVYIDTETTGLSRRDRIVEISAIRVRDNKIVESFSELVNPHMHIEEDATNINGITDSMVVNKPSFSSIEQNFLQFIGDDILVGHNISFDADFIGREIGESLRNPMFDSIQLAKAVMDGVENYKLETICRKLGFPHQKHRSLTDAALTFRVVQALKDIASKNKKGIGDSMPFSYSSKTYSIKLADIVPDEDAVTGFFAGKRVVFSGVLPIRRREAMQAVVNQGGKIGTTITKTTDYLVIGDGDAEQTARLQAVKAISEGQDLKILSSSAFLEKIGQNTNQNPV